MGKGEIAQNFFPHLFFYAICILNPLVATFQLSSAASLNLGRSQNGVLGNGLTQGTEREVLLVVSERILVKILRERERRERERERERERLWK